MAELVLHARTLPEPLYRLIHTEKVKIRESHGEIHLIPINDNVSTNDCPLLGLYSGGKLTVDMHHAWSREDKELEK